MNQTLLLTTLGDFEPNRSVNLEPALKAGEPLGGHFVQGHVDGTGDVVASSEDGFSRRLRVSLPAELGGYVVEHGSIAVDGVSLTVSGLGDDWFEVALIPETLDRTTLGDLAEGDSVNLEVDLIARYTERLVQGYAGAEGASMTESSPATDPAEADAGADKGSPSDERGQGVRAERSIRRALVLGREQSNRRVCSPPSRRPSRRSAAAGWSSSVTTSIARTRVTSRWRHSSRRPKRSTSWPPTGAG